MSKWLAHRAEDGREQTVLEHLKGTADLCAQFAAAFGAEEQGYLAGLAHDIGKYSLAFQRRLNGGPKVDHATAGAFECNNMGQPFAALSVAGHHGGLPDGGKLEAKDACGAVLLVTAILTPLTQCVHLLSDTYLYYGASPPSRGARIEIVYHHNGDELERCHPLYRDADRNT